MHSLAGTQQGFGYRKAVSIILCFGFFPGELFKIGD